MAGIRLLNQKVLSVEINIRKKNMRKGDYYGGNH